MLHVDSVTICYGSSPAVDHVTLTAAAGEWLSIVGPNGAGKSSLLRAVAHLQPYDGTITINGTVTGQLSRRRHARLVAYVPQQPEIPSGMSVIDYALLGRTPHIGYLGAESQEDRRSCLALLTRLGIDDLAGRMLPTLSGGEMQRAVLARALAQQAPVLLLDEPTSALDLGNRVDALELVDELRIERDLIVLSVMHDLTLAAQFSDRLALLDRGQCVALGTAHEVLDETVLTRIFGGSVRVITDEAGNLIVAPTRRRQSA